MRIERVNTVLFFIICILYSERTDTLFCELLYSSWRLYCMFYKYIFIWTEICGGDGGALLWCPMCSLLPVAVLCHVTLYIIYSCCRFFSLAAMLRLPSSVLNTTPVCHEKGYIWNTREKVRWHDSEEGSGNRMAAAAGGSEEKGPHQIDPVTPFYSNFHSTSPSCELGIEQRYFLFFSIFFFFLR